VIHVPTPKMYNDVVQEKRAKENELQST